MPKLIAQSRPLALGPCHVTSARLVVEFPKGLTDGHTLRSPTSCSKVNVYLQPYFLLISTFCRVIEGPKMKWAGCELMKNWTFHCVFCAHRLAQEEEDDGHRATHMVFARLLLGCGLWNFAENFWPLASYSSLLPLKRTARILIGGKLDSSFFQSPCTGINVDLALIFQQAQKGQDTRISVYPNRQENCVNRWLAFAF